MATREKQEALAEEVRGGWASLPHVNRGLSVKVKRRIVELFAQFHSVSAIREIIEEEFGFRPEASKVSQYNPEREYSIIGKALREHHKLARAAYVQGLYEQGIGHQAHRLRLLSRIVEKAEKAKDFSNAIKGLELAAKEMGGFLTNVAKVEHSGKVEHRHLSVEDAKAELAMRLGAMIDGDILLPKPEEPKLLEDKGAPQG